MHRGIHPTILGLAALGVFALTASPVAALRASEGCAHSKLDSGRKIERKVRVGELDRDFILDVPESVKPREPVPLLFDFHGFGHSGAGVWKVSAFKEIAQREGFVTVYPTGLPITIELRGASHTGPGWQMRAGDDNRDLAFTRAMLASIESEYCIDLDRVYSTGFSNGAFFSSLLGCQMSDRFAAVAPVSGGAVRDECAPERPVPVLIHHGTRDDLITVERARASRDQWLKANGCKPSGDEPTSGPRCERYTECRADAAVVYCEEEFAHRWPPQATGRIWSFFKQHGR